MAYDLILRLQAHGIAYVVAPYEADSQLAYLATLPEEQGGVAAVMTEDSDLIVYGCTTLLFKCKVATNGYAQELLAETLFSGVQALDVPKQQQADGAPPTAHGQQEQTLNGCFAGQAGEGIAIGVTAAPTSSKGANQVDFKGWDLEMLRAVCVLAGCDYLKSIKGIGFKRAHKLVAKGRSLEGTLRMMSRDAK